MLYKLRDKTDSGSARDAAHIRKSHKFREHVAMRKFSRFGPKQRFCLFVCGLVFVVVSKQAGSIQEALAFATKFFYKVIVNRSVISAGGVAK